VTTSAGRGAAYTSPHRWSRPRGVVPCRQDPRVGGVQQSVRASSPQPAMSVHTARARGPRACAVAVADGLGRSPTCAPCRHDRGGPAWCYEPPRGSWCWGLAPTLWPSSAANGHGPGPNSMSHGLPHSCVDRLSLTWQHRSPSGPVVLHLELELKLYSLVKKRPQGLGRGREKKRLAHLAQDTRSAVGPWSRSGRERDSG
jgi:hypothetical protein